MHLMSLVHEGREYFRNRSVPDDSRSKLHNYIHFIVFFIIIVITVNICLPLRVVVNGTSHIYHDNFENHFNKGATHSKCLIYDKPPRTASSTISRSLRTCWTSQNYSIFHSTYDTPFNATLSEMLNTTSDRIGISGVHFGMLPDQIEALYHECESVMYITSTRSMGPRIASAAKYKVSQARVYLNTTLNHTQMEEAWNISVEIINEEQVERRLENYPFDGREIQPDFVVRNDHLQSDLADLLSAFNCSVSVRSKNLHVYESEEESDDEIPQFDFKKLSIKLGDARHKKLVTLAKHHNQQGLERARFFRKVVSTDPEP